MGRLTAADLLNGLSFSARAWLIDGGDLRGPHRDELRAKRLIELVTGLPRPPLTALGHEVQRILRGVGRRKKVAYLRATMSPEAETPPKPRLEKFEQADGIKLLQSLGAKVYTLGTRRPRGTRCRQCGAFVAESQGTRQTPGLPDVYAVLPGDRERTSRALWWEVKRATGGRLSSAQEEFRDLCLASDTAHVDGSVDALIAWLTTNGYLRGDQVPQYRQEAR
jgi:hypothetical protein